MPLLKKTPIILQPTPKYTMGHSSPDNGKRGCLSPDGTTYGRQYCKGYLISQGVGSVDGIPLVKRKAFSKAFSGGFA